MKNVPTSIEGTANTLSDTIGKNKIVLEKVQRISSKCYFFNPF